MDELKVGLEYQCLGRNVEALELFKSAHLKLKMLCDEDAQKWKYMYTEALRNYALALDSTNQLQLQEELYDELQKLTPAGLFLGDYAVWLHKRKKDYVKANLVYVKAIELFPSHSSIIFKYAGFLRHIRSDLDGASTYYEKAVQVNQENADAVGALASFLHGVKQDYERANSFYESAIALDDTHLNNLCNFGLYLSEQKRDYTRAEAIFLRALEVAPNHPNSMYNYAVMLDTHCNRKPEAEVLYRSVIAADASHSYALYNLSQLLESKLKETSDADDKTALIKEIQALYNTLIKVDNSDAVALGDYGRFLLTYTEFYKNAEKLLLKAVDIDGEAELGLFYLGLLYQKHLKDLPKSEQYLRRLLANHAHHLAGLRLLNEVLQSKGGSSHDAEVLDLYERSMLEISAGLTETSVTAHAYVNFILKKQNPDFKERGTSFFHALLDDAAFLLHRTNAGVNTAETIKEFNEWAYDILLLPPPVPLYLAFRAWLLLVLGGGVLYCGSCSIRHQHRKRKRCSSARKKVAERRTTPKKALLKY